MRNPAAPAAGGPPALLGAAGTLAVHGLLALTFVLARTSDPPRRMPIAYKVNLVAAPAAAGAAEPATAAPVSPPEPVPPARTPPANRPAPAPASAPTRAAPPAATPATPQPAPATPAQPTPGPSAAPTATPGTGSDVATVRTEGVEFPFPGYLRNIVGQVYRRWRPPPSSTQLEAEVFFYVHRDGSVTGIQFIRRSGAFTFDLEAQGAIEAAARAGAFGRLPDGYAADVLPVSFFFSPRNVR